MVEDKTHTVVLPHLLEDVASPFSKMEMQTSAGDSQEEVGRPTTDKGLVSGSGDRCCTLAASIPSAHWPVSYHLSLPVHQTCDLTEEENKSQSAGEKRRAHFCS